MKITKDGENMVVTIPLEQKIHNPYMDENEDLGEMDNLVGIIAGNEYSISTLIDMDYKGKPPQEGMPILMFCDREELEKVCKDFNIIIWEHPLCAYCKAAIRGCFTVGKLGNMCFGCELKDKYNDERYHSKKKSCCSLNPCNCVCHKK